jgi:hypothetical protein
MKLDNPLKLAGPNSYIINFKDGSVSPQLPRRQPLVLTLPEVSDSGGRCIGPGLATWIGHPIGEISHTTTSQVKYNVKFLIERCHFGITGPPRIGESARIEVTPFPETTIWRSISGQSYVIDQKSDVAFRPHHLVVVKVAVVSVRVGSFGVSVHEHVEGLRWSPMKSRTDQFVADVVTSTVVQFGVATTFHYVDLAGTRPSGVLVISRHHPNSRPQPISSGEFRSNFNFTIFEGEGVHGSETSAFDWVKIILWGSRSFATVKLWVGTPEQCN